MVSVGHYRCVDQTFSAPVLILIVEIRMKDLQKLVSGDLSVLVVAGLMNAGMWWLLKILQFSLVLLPDGVHQFESFIDLREAETFLLIPSHEVISHHFLSLLSSSFLSSAGGGECCG